jgi:hypothetical protein
MRFSPRSLWAWIAVAIAGGDPLGRDAATGMALSDLAEVGPDDEPAEHAPPAR